MLAGLRSARALRRVPPRLASVPRAHPHSHRLALAPNPALTRPASQTASALADRMRAAAGRAAAPGPAPKFPASHKPPKRRLEAISAPLRNNPAPTRGPILQCIAHTTAERYDLVGLGAVLRRLGVRWDEVPEGDQDRAVVIGPWKGRGGAERLIRGRELRQIEEEGAEDMDKEIEKDNGFEYGERGEIWVFSSGSFVTWGLSEEEGRAFLRDVVRAKGARVEMDRLGAEEYEVEEVDFVVDPMAETSVLGNLILLGRPPELSTFSSSPSLASLLVRYTLSLSLARSSSLSVLEDRLDSHIASVSLLPRALEKFGEQPLGRREVIRKIGELMVLRMAVNTRGGGLENTPEFFWSEPALEEHFDSVAKEFEIKERVDLLNRKIDYAQEIQNTLRALLTEASGHRMELIIIALIAVEVVIALIREGPELWHGFATPMIRTAHSIISAVVGLAHPDDAAEADAAARERAAQQVRELQRRAAAGATEAPPSRPTPRLV